MFSRGLKMIKKHVGLGLVIVSFIWLMGVAGQEDYNTEVGLVTPVLPMILKAAAGLIGMAIGVKLAGGKKCE